MHQSLHNSRSMWIRYGSYSFSFTLPERRKKITDKAGGNTVVDQ